MDYAVELLWKMRQRGINCNVHTYSCLMNVCIKNSDLDMALNVFQKLQVVLKTCWCNPVSGTNDTSFASSMCAKGILERAQPCRSGETRHNAFLLCCRLMVSKQIL